MDALALWADRYLIELYRMTGHPLADYFIGTFVLAIFSVLIGEATVSLLRRVNRRHITRLDGELAAKHELSLAAKRSGDEESYRALNREANDAFGRVFFNMFTFSAASLWSAFMALAWMQTRFMDVEFPVAAWLPLLGNTVGYVFIFFLYYVLLRVLLSAAKKHMAKVL